jgi:hypothetical protein
MIRKHFWRPDLFDKARERLYRRSCLLKIINDCMKGREEWDFLQYHVRNL